MIKDADRSHLLDFCKLPFQEGTTANQAIVETFESLVDPDSVIVNGRSHTNITDLGWVLMSGTLSFSDGLDSLQGRVFLGKKDVGSRHKHKQRRYKSFHNTLLNRTLRLLIFPGVGRGYLGQQMENIIGYNIGGNLNKEVPGIMIASGNVKDMPFDGRYIHDRKGDAKAVILERELDVSRVGNHERALWHFMYEKIGGDLQRKVESS